MNQEPQRVEAGGDGPPGPGSDAGRGPECDVCAQSYTLNSAIDHQLPEVLVLTTLT
jgi:hypothetical protein